MSLDAFICPICRRPYPADVRSLFCRACGDPLLSAFVPKSPAIRRGRPMGVARYLGFLPLPEFDPDLSLGEGGTPLFPLNRLRSAFRTPPLWVKNEAVNPTGSFKDRGSIVAIHMAKALGFETVGTISTGNMAGSTAAYAAKAGLRTVVFIKDDTPLEKNPVRRDAWSQRHPGPRQLRPPFREKLRDRPGLELLLHQLRRSVSHRRIQGHVLRNL
jgi:Threonine synthase